MGGQSVNERLVGARRPSIQDGSNRGVPYDGQLHDQRQEELSATLPTRHGLQLPVQAGGE